MHYSYFFRNTEPSGTETKDVNFSRLGTMLHIEIKQGKEDIKTSTFQKDIGGTAVCMKRLMMATKGCGQLTSNGTYFYDS